MMIAILGNPTSDCYLYVCTNLFLIFTGKPLDNSTTLKIDAQTLNMKPKTINIKKEPKYEVKEEFSECEQSGMDIIQNLANPFQLEDNENNANLYDMNSFQLIQIAEKLYEEKQIWEDTKEFYDMQIKKQDDQVQLLEKEIGKKDEEINRLIQDNQSYEEIGSELIEENEELSSCIEVLENIRKLEEKEKLEELIQLEKYRIRARNASPPPEKSDAIQKKNNRDIEWFTQTKEKTGKQQEHQNFKLIKIQIDENMRNNSDADKNIEVSALPSTEDKEKGLKKETSIMGVNKGGSRFCQKRRRPQAAVAWHITTRSPSFRKPLTPMSIIESPLSSKLLIEMLGPEKKEHAIIKMENNEKPPRKEQKQENYKRKSQQDAEITTLKKVKKEPKLDSEDKKSNTLSYPVNVKAEKDGHLKYESSAKECQDMKKIIKAKTTKTETDHSTHLCMGDNLVAYLSRFVKKEPNLLISEKTV